MVAEPLRQYLKVQVSADRELLKLLRSAKADLDRQLSTILGDRIGAQVRREQLRLAQAAIDRELDRIWRKTQGIIETHAQSAATAAVAADGALDRVLRASGLSGAERAAIGRSLELQARTAVQAALTRRFDTSGVSRIPLSERVYHSRQVIDRQVERLVNSALARGLSAREFASEVRQFIRPDTPGGARYASMRLARTEINNSFHLAQKTDLAARPWVTGVKWNLSGSHPHTDICNAYADDNHANMGAGVYRKGDVPAKPHPHCLCFITPETVSEEQFVKNFKAGQYDNFLNERLPLTPAPSPLPVARPKLAPVKRLLQPPAERVPTPQVTAKIPEPPKVTVPIRGFSAADEEVISRAAQVQAEFAPNSLAKLQEIKRLQGAEEAQFLRTYGRDALGGYHESAIRVTSKVMDPSFQVAHIRAVNSGWFSKSAPEVTGVENFISHEFGHFMERLARADGLKNIKPFWQSVASEFGLEPPVAYNSIILRSWVAENKAVLAREVSRYGATSSEELVAEIWAEYTGGAARPAIKRLGKILQDIAEKSGGLT